MHLPVLEKYSYFPVLNFKWKKSVLISRYYIYIYNRGIHFKFTDGCFLKEREKKMNAEQMVMDVMNKVAISAALFLVVVVVLTILWIASVTRDINK